METPAPMTPWEKFSAGFEVALLVVMTAGLYLSALLAFPIFRYSHGLAVFLDGDKIFPFRTMDLVPMSVGFFALSGAVLVRWTPALPTRRVAWTWAAAYALYWIDTVTALVRNSGGWEPLDLLALGVLFLLVFFKLLDWAGPSGHPLYQPPTWRSHFAGAWLITWMAFFLGLSSVMVADLPLFPWSRLALGLGSLGLTGLLYGLAYDLRQAEGRELGGLDHGWRWMLSAWMVLALLMAGLHQFLGI